MIEKWSFPALSLKQISLNIFIFAFLEIKWHSKTPNAIGLNLQPLTHEGSQDAEIKSVGKSLVKYTSLSQRLFTHNLSKKIRTMALSTNFVTGMADGSLPLRRYRNYLVQDALYFSNVARLYEMAALRMEQKLGQENEVFSVFFWQQFAKFRKLHEDLVTDKKVNPETEEASLAMRMYMGFQEAVISGGNDPRLLVIAMLPCSMLYPELASTVKIINPEGNVYKDDWFEENRRDGETSTEMFVNEHLVMEQKLYLLIEYIFLQALLHELNFHREIGGQPPLSLEDVKKITSSM